MRTIARSRFGKYVLGAALLTGAFVGGVGWLHTPSGRPFLAKLGVGCPVMASGADVERARLTVAREVRGRTASPARPAFGFVLDKTTVSDIERWASTSGAHCTTERQKTLVRCTAVPSQVLGQAGAPIEELTFGFSPAGQLVNADAFHRSTDGAVIASEMEQITERLKSQLGPPASAKGAMTPGYLVEHPMNTALVEYRYRDYLADVTATNLSGHGVVLREHYMAIED